jgi:hypothetical protein
MRADPIALWSSLPASPQMSKTMMSSLELDGYLTGIAVTPQAAPIRPSTWMARLGKQSRSLTSALSDGAFARGFTNAWRSSLRTDGVKGVGQVRSKHR